MPSINNVFLSELQDDYKKYPCFVEICSSNKPNMIGLEPFFESLHSIFELNKKCFDAAKLEYSGNKINYVYCDNGLTLNSLIPSITDKCIFFLDGCWNNSNPKIKKGYPLLFDITNIHNLLKNEAIIIVDDFKLYELVKENKCYEDCSEIKIKKILNIIKSRVNNIYEKDNKLILHINSKEVLCVESKIEISE